MLKIRALTLDDIDKIREIHSLYYKDEFEFPDFMNNFLCSFSVLDCCDRIVSAGGVRLIAESVVVTDKRFSTNDRRSALYQVLDASEFIAKKADFSSLHAVTEDEKWKRHLISVGFHSRGSLLVLDL